MVESFSLSGKIKVDKARYDNKNEGGKLYLKTLFGRYFGAFLYSQSVTKLKITLGIHAAT
jgi:hypothetical protein